MVGRCGGLMVSRLGPGSSTLCYVFGQDTLSTQNTNQERGGGGRVNYSWSLHATETRIRPNLTSHLTLCTLNLFLPTRGSVRSQ